MLCYQMILLFLLLLALVAKSVDVVMEFSYSIFIRMEPTELLGVADYYCICNPMITKFPVKPVCDSCDQLVVWKCIFCNYENVFPSERTIVEHLGTACANLSSYTQTYYSQLSHPKHSNGTQ